jgi:hypothetical protein
MPDELTFSELFGMGDDTETDDIDLYEAVRYGGTLPSYYED